MSKTAPPFCECRNTAGLPGDGSKAIGSDEPIALEPPQTVFMPRPPAKPPYSVRERSSLQEQEPLTCFTREGLLLLERRRRDLNPRAAINDLHPFQGCPFGQLGYFSKLLESINDMNFYIGLTPTAKMIIPEPHTKCKPYFSFSSGEDGIRTHAPRRTNGFQDRLVMTASIPLHNRLKQAH